MRISLGLTLLWIGCIDLLDPRAPVSLLSLSLPFLAFNQFVYALKVLEIIGGILLIVGVWVRYVALASLALFAGTLVIFVIAPSVTEFPLLSLRGQFLLKDTVLASAAITLMALDAASYEAKLAERIQLISQPEELPGRRLGTVASTTPASFQVLFRFAESVAGPLLRISLGMVLLWIGCIHLFEPQPVVNLLSQSLPFLAFSAFVYLLGGLEAIAGILLLAGHWIRFVALLSLPLFAGTLTIFVVAPGVTGFPLLTLVGQFILKDTVLASAAIALIARDAASHAAGLPERSQLQSSSEGPGVRRPAA
jgi:uncharacterized membrane protein YkgB